MPVFIGVGWWMTDYIWLVIMLINESELKWDIEKFGYTMSISDEQ